MTTATAKGIPIPEDTDPPLVPQDIGNIAQWLDTNPGVASYSQAEIDGLSAIDKWTGRVVYNETTFTHQGWNGTTWLPIGAGVQAFTQAQIDALPAAQKSLGMILWNTTTAQHQAWDGAKWVFVDAVPKVADQTAATALGALPDGTLVWCVNPPQWLAWKAGTWHVESGNSPNSTANLDNYDTAARVPWGYLGLNTDYSMWEGNVAAGPLWDFAGIPKLTTTQRDGLAAKRKRPGCVIWNTTTIRHEWWDSTTWRALNPYTSGAYGAVAQYAIPTGVATAGTAIKPVGTFTFPALAGRVYEVVGVGPFQMTAAEDIANFIIMDAAVIVSSTALTQGANKYGTLPIAGRVRAGAASRTVTITVNIQASFGAGSMNTQANGNIYVYDAGEDAQVTTPTTIVPPDLWNAGWGFATAPVVNAGAVNLPASEGTLVALSFKPQLGRRYRVRGTFGTYKVGGVGTVLAALRRGSAGTGVMLDTTGQGSTATNLDVFTEGYDVGPFDGTTTITYTLSGWSTPGGTAVDVTYGPPTITAEDVGPASATPPASWPPKPNPGPWIAPAFLNGWVNAGAGSTPARYRLVGDVVQIEGFVKTGTVGTVVFNLPAGYRPLTQMQRPVYSSAQTVAGIAITTGGDVFHQFGGNAGIDLACQFATS